MTRFEVRESLALTGRGPWVLGTLRSGPLAAGDPLRVAHSGAVVRVREVADREGGVAVLLDRSDAVEVPPGSVLIGPADPVPDDALPPPDRMSGPVHYEVLDTFAHITGRGPAVVGLLRRGEIRRGDVLAVVGSGEPVRVTGVELHRRETVDGVVLGIGIHPEDADGVAVGGTLVSREGHRR